MGLDMACLTPAADMPQAVFWPEGRNKHAHPGTSAIPQRPSLRHAQEALTSAGRLSNDRLNTGRPVPVRATGVYVGCMWGAEYLEVRRTGATEGVRRSETPDEQSYSMDTPYGKETLIVQPASIDLAVVITVRWKMFDPWYWIAALSC